MRYHYEINPDCTPIFGEVIECDHPVYSKCTLYKEAERGLAVIQQYYDQVTKTTWWAEIDPQLQNDLYIHKSFARIFAERAGKCVNGLWPTVTVRQLMWAMRMKPLKRERWETCFDRRVI